MISTDVLALIQLNPPGIELYRVSNIQNEGEEGATISSRHSSQNDGPRIDRLCTLLFPPLRPGLQSYVSGAGASVYTASCVGEHPGHQKNSYEPGPECHRAQLGRSQIFRQSTRDSIISVIMTLVRGKPDNLRLFGLEVVVRCDTLLSYADRVHVVPAAAVVGNVNPKECDETDVVPWDAWGPQVTSATAIDSMRTGCQWISLFGERRATVEMWGPIRIRDYNSYRIQQARDSDVGLSRNSTCRIVESTTIPAGKWFKEDVTTALPYLDIVVDVPGGKGCSAIYLEQDEILVRTRYLPVYKVSAAVIDR
jgi:hypothetical protein